MYTDFTNVVRESLQLLMAFVFVRKSETEGCSWSDLASWNGNAMQGAKRKVMDEINKTCVEVVVFNQKTYEIKDW